jgi:hypothetical protein
MNWQQLVNDARPPPTFQIGSTATSRWSLQLPAQFIAMVDEELAKYANR